MLAVKAIRKRHGTGLKGVIDGLAGSAARGTNEALEYTGGLAVKFSRGRVADGIKADEIKIELINPQTFEVKGRIYTTSPFSAFLEYGTGIYMEDNPLGHIPGSAGARGEPWFVHEEMADLSKYHFPVLETVAGKFYVIQGTHAHPYMKPAAFQSRDEDVRKVLDAVRRMIREVTR